MFYVIDDNKNKIEALSKEDVYAILEQAIEDGDLEHVEADSAFVSKLKSIVNGSVHHVEFVTQAQFNELQQSGELISGCYYFITDDDTADDLEDAVEELSGDIDALEDRTDNAETAITTLQGNVTTLQADSRKKADALYDAFPSGGNIIVYEDESYTGNQDVTDYMKSGKTATDIIGFSVNVEIQGSYWKVAGRVNVVCYTDGAGIGSFFGKVTALSGGSGAYIGKIFGATLGFVFEQSGAYTELETDISSFISISDTTLSPTMENVILSRLTFMYK